ncbi:hypothetical protein B9T07_25595, partial [Limnospira fusiformis CCALA 023]
SDNFISRVYLNDGSGGFTEATNISLTVVGYSSVATADLNGDGHIDILLTGQDSSDNFISRVYLNDGSGGFTEATNISLTGVGYSSVATADLNGDGHIDILLTGDSDSGSISRVYLNDGSGGFTEATNISLTGVYQSSVGTADLNGDGHIDILITVRDSDFEPISRVYLNDGSGGFTEATNISLTGVYNGPVATADFNGYGHIDILLTGRDSDFEPISRVYLNDGSGGFTEATNIFLTGVADSSVATADFNGDGHIDILLTGMDSSFQPISRVYLNDGSGGFTEATNISLTGVRYSSVATADFNGDGDIDILLTGVDSSNNPISRVYNNDTVFASPAKAIYEAHSSNGTWQYSTDGGATWVDFPVVSETNALLLDGSSQVRFVPNPDYRGEATYNFRAWDQSDRLSVGTTADVSTNGGTTAYSGETATATITINPVKQAPILSQTEFTLTAVNQGTTDHTGDNLGTIIGDSITVDEPTNILDFSLNTNISLTGVYFSSVATADFNGDGHIDILLTGQSDSGPISQVYLNDRSGRFTQATNISLTGVGYSSVATGDFNGDGDIDILLTGRDSGNNPISRVYLNDGSGGFTEATNISLTGVGYSSVATGDFNGDGDIDILLTGEDSDSGFISQVYLNDGSGGFTEATNISLIGVAASSVATADLNGDGYIDILLTGQDSSDNFISRVYLNDGSGEFTEATNISLTGVYNGSVATADFNGDGHIDILLTGLDSSNNRISRVYLNDGSGGFTEATNISLTGVDFSSVATGDFNGDGDIDILLTGEDSDSGFISQVYLNDGSGGFTEATNISLIGVAASSVATADFNGDGDIDILLTGFDSDFSPISQVYTNDPIEVPPGKAIYEADSSNGTWQYSTDGGATWVDFPTVSETNALLLDSSSQVR